MQNAAIILIGITAFLNSISIIALAVSIKGQAKQLNAVRGKLLEITPDPKKYLDFANNCFKNFCYVKDGFRKVRKELIRKGVLTEDFTYLNEDEAVEEFIDDFLKS